MRKSTMSRRLEFSPTVRQKIIERDQGCFFCRACITWSTPCQVIFAPKDIMHIVARSQLGLGVEQNGVLGCRYHHSLLDNGNKGLHREMDSMLQDYMRELYPGWTPDSVTYHKWL